MEMKLRTLLGRIYTSGEGFTLIELLLVIAIISILILAVIFALNPFEQIKKANDGRRKSDLSEVQKALELYYQDNGSYPPVKSGTNEPDWGTNQSTYISKMPIDPKSTQQYIYAVSGNDTYVIYASLERGTKDPQACGSACRLGSFGLSVSACGGLGCNYGVSSPNTTP